MVGFGANRRGGRLPSLILIFLMVLIVVVSYNYWSVTRQHGRALDELAEVQAQVKRTDAARSRLEKRNSELMLQVDTHRRQIDQKDGDYSVLESKLQARDALAKKCTDDKMKVQNDFTLQSSEITRLKEQVKELKQEIIRQEDQVRELKKNTTNLERKLEYESLQCGRQLAQLKDEYEESKRLMVEQAAKSKLSKMDESKVSTVASRAEKPDPKNAGEPQPEAAQQHDKPDMKEEMGKPGSDAGMPGIEDSEVGKVDDMHFALKKPAITQTHKEHVEDADLIKDKQIGGGAGGGDGEEPRVGAGIREGEGAGIGAGFEAGVENAIDAGEKAGAGMGPEAGARFNVPQDLPLGHPDRPHPGGPGGGLGMGHNMMPVQQQVPQPVVDRPVVMDENNKADEFGEQQRQIRGRDGQGAALPPPPNPAQVLPNPIDPQRDAAPLRHRQSRFFDENESPVDPQRASKLADYNGDDGNVGEYEADKQAELAYNEEEDGDGGEEDAQDDEDREVPGDHGVDYGKRRQAMDIL